MIVPIHSSSTQKHLDTHSEHIDTNRDKSAKKIKSTANIVHLFSGGYFSYIYFVHVRVYV